MKCIQGPGKTSERKRLGGDAVMWPGPSLKNGAAATQP